MRIRSEWQSKWGRRIWIFDKYSELEWTPLLFYLLFLIAVDSTLSWNGEDYDGDSPNSINVFLLPFSLSLEVYFVCVCAMHWRRCLLLLWEMLSVCVCVRCDAYPSIAFEAVILSEKALETLPLIIYKSEKWRKKEHSEQVPSK